MSIYREFTYEEMIAYCRCHEEYIPLLEDLGKKHFVGALTQKEVESILRNKVSFEMQIEADREAREQREYELRREAREREEEKEREIRAAKRREQRERQKARRLKQLAAAKEAHHEMLITGFTAIGHIKPGDLDWL